jgi:hypothetical protein
MSVGSQTTQDRGGALAKEGIVNVTWIAPAHGAGVATVSHFADAGPRSAGTGQLSSRFR